jgi:hypothetical protein
LQVTRHTADESGLNYGALTGGRIWHPTKVQVNFKFGLGVAGEKGKDSIERGYDLEQQVPLRSVKVGAPLFLSAPLPRVPSCRSSCRMRNCPAVPRGQVPAAEGSPAAAHRD